MGSTDGQSIQDADRLDRSELVDVGMCLTLHTEMEITSVVVRQLTTSSVENSLLGFFVSHEKVPHSSVVGA